MSLTEQQQQKIRRMRKAGVECLEIAAAMKLDVKAVSGFIANQKNQRAMARASSIAKLVTVKDPEKLAEIAAERKPRMFLLPYGIPIAIGSIGYFAWHGMQL